MDLALTVTRNGLDYDVFKHYLSSCDYFELRLHNRNGYKGFKKEVETQAYKYVKGCVDELLRDVRY